MFQEIENILINEKFNQESQTENILEDGINLKDYYQILDYNLSDEFTKHELKKRYRQKSLKYHPDRHSNLNNQQLKEEYEMKFKQLSKAYKFLLKNVDFIDN